MTKVNFSKTININKYSFLNKSLRITCWVVKVKDKFLAKLNENIKNKIEKESVAEEMINGLDVSIAKKMQFREVQKDLKNIPNFQNSCTQLHLFENEDGIWLCGGRLAKSNLPYLVIHSCFVIPNFHYFTEPVVFKSHTNVKHRDQRYLKHGVRDTLNSLLEEFWITKERNFEKAVINIVLLLQNLK